MKIEGMLKSKPASGGTFYKGQVRGRACHPGLRPCAQDWAACRSVQRCADSASGEHAWERGEAKVPVTLPAASCHASGALAHGTKVAAAAL